MKVHSARESQNQKWSLVLLIITKSSIVIIYTQDVFNILDFDRDGFISKDEFACAKLGFLMCCGPENPIKLFYGPVVEDEDEHKNSEENKHSFK